MIYSFRKLSPSLIGSFCDGLASIPFDHWVLIEPVLTQAAQLGLCADTFFLFYYPGGGEPGIFWVSFNLSLKKRLRPLGYCAPICAY